MVTTKVQIINLALAKLSSLNPVQDLSENSPEAAQAAAHYDVCLQSVLAAHPWDFARKTARLALVSGSAALTGWARHYSYPADCVRVCRVYPADNPYLSPPWLIGQGLAGSQLVVMSNQEDAVAEYVLADPPVVHMPAAFVNALAWRLAAEIGLATAKPAAGQLLQAYQCQLEEAKLADAREAGPRSRADGQWIQDRTAGYAVRQAQPREG